MCATLYLIWLRVAFHTNVALQVGESPARYRVVHTADELLA